MGNFQNSDWFEGFCAQAAEKTYKRGDIFTLQGETQNTVGLVLSGKASALAFSYKGDETWVGEYNEGHFIGLTSILTDDISNFEVRATSKLTVRLISKPKMLELMEENRTLLEAIAKDIAKRLNHSISDLIDVHSLSVKGRVCAELLRLALPIGIDPDRRIIRPSPIFVELARRLNSTRETVSRTVSELQGKGILVREPGALIIADPDRLQDAIEYI